MQIVETTTPKHSFARLALLLSLGLVAFLALLQIFWVGFIGADDELYWRAAGGWVSHFPYLGRDHWGLRHTLVVPIALARLAFGNSMFAMSLPTVLYAMALVVLIGYWTWHSLGVGAAALAIALVITDPQLVLWSSTADVDIPEIFFVVAAFFVLDRAMSRMAKRTTLARDTSRICLLLLTSGALIGLAMLSRETAVFAAAAIVMLFVVGYGMSRVWYFVVGAGCVLVLGLETLLLWGATGDWFYRSSIDVNHDHTINRWLDQGASIPFLHPLIDPITMFLLNHNFGLITWLGLPLVVWLFSRHILAGDAKRQAVLLAALALVWTALSAGLWKLLPLIPRYYLLPSIMISVLSAMALVRLWGLGRQTLVISVTTLFIVGNLVALSIDNRQFMFGAHTLVKVASISTETVHTDSQTSRRANLLLEWSGVRDKVIKTPPQRGDLYFFNPTMSGVANNPGNDWVVVERYPIPESGARWIACRMPTGLVPHAMVEKFKCGQGAAVLYRVG